jgi:hypothetical protein
MGVETLKIPTINICLLYTGKGILLVEKKGVDK